MEEIKIGRVTHYYTHLGVAAIDILDGIIRVGDTMHIKGHTTDMTQKLESIEVEHEHIEEASAGQTIGVKVREHVRVNDTVYKVVE